MAERVKPGRLSVTQRGLNNALAAGESHVRAQVLGAVPPTPGRINWHTVAKVHNLTSQTVRRGEILELQQSPLSEPQNSSLWLEGQAVDLSRPGWGIALDPVPSDRVGDVLIWGVCLGLVEITDAGHHFARRINGESVLRSSDRGAVKILHSPGGLGEKECLVQILDDTPLWYLGVVRTEFTQGYDPAGTISLDIYAWDEDAVKWRKAPDVVIEARDWFLQKDEKLEKGVKVRVDWYINCWVVTAMHCSPTDLDDFKSSPSTGSPGEMESGGGGDTPASGSPMISDPILEEV